MKKVLVLFLLVLVSALPASPAIAAGQTPEAVLNAFHNGSRALIITYRTGKPNYRGEVSMTVTGDGQVDFLWRHRGKKKAIKTLLTQDSVKLIVETMLEAKFWSYMEAKKPHPHDAAIIEIGISTKGKDLDFKRSFLETEVYQDLGMATLANIFGSITRTLREGPSKDRK